MFRIRGVPKVFCFLLFEGTSTSFFTDKKSERSRKTVEIKGFFYFFFLMIRGSGSGKPKNLDSEHWKNKCNLPTLYVPLFLLSIYRCPIYHSVCALPIIQFYDLVPLLTSVACGPITIWCGSGSGSGDPCL